MAFCSEKKKSNDNPLLFFAGIHNWPSTWSKDCKCTTNIIKLSTDFPYKKSKLCNYFHYNYKHKCLDWCLMGFPEIIFKIHSKLSKSVKI